MIDHSPLTQTTGKFLTTRLPSNMIRVTKLSSSNPKKKKKKFVETFIFHSTNSIVSISSVYQRERKNETRAKLDNRGTQHGGDSPQCRAGTVLDDAVEQTVVWRR